LSWSQTAGTVKWTYSTGEEIYSSPAIGPDGVLYIGVNDDTDDGVNDNKVIAVNPDGTLKWEAEVGDWVENTPALGPSNVLYVGSWDGFLYALDMETGAEVWKFESFGVIESSAAIGNDGVIYFGNGENALYAVNPDGTPVWTGLLNGEDASPYIFRNENGLGDSVDASPAIGADGNIVAGDLFGNFAIIRPDKSEVWTHDFGFGFASSPAIGDDGTIYIGDEDGLILALSPGDSNPKWFFNTGIADIESSPTIGPDGTVYVGTESGELYALDGQTGNVKSGWPFEGAGNEIYSSPAVAEDGTVYVGSGDGKLYAVNSSGVELWSINTGGLVDSSPAIGVDGTVYVGTSNGDLYAIHGNSPLADSPWPKFRANLSSTGNNIDPYVFWIGGQGVEDTDPYADPDLDGRANILEWALGTLAGVPDNGDSVTPVLLPVGDRVHMMGAWRPEATNVGFQFSSDLNSWQDIDLLNPDSYTWIFQLTQDWVDGKKQYLLEIDPEDPSAAFFRISELGN
jgi:outer membrane protein assembly factor BamB